MSSVDWTASSRIKIERAQKHIDDLYSETSAWATSDPRPYELVTDKDDNPGGWVVRARLNSTPDVRWGAIAGDAIHNLSAALDVLIHQLVRARGEVPNAKLQFRVFDSRSDFEKARFPEIERSGQGAVDLFKGAEPYKGGKSPLWLIRRLDELDKHRVLTPIAIGHKKTGIDVGFGMVVGFYMGSWQPVEDGAVVHRYTTSRWDGESYVPTDQPEVHTGPQVAYDVALGQSEVLPELEPVVPLLTNAADFVKTFVAAFAELIR